MLHLLEDIARLVRAIRVYRPSFVYAASENPLVDHSYLTGMLDECEATFVRHAPSAFRDTCRAGNPWRVDLGRGP